MFIKIVCGAIGLLIALVFFAIPILKIRETALIVVVLIGVAMMVYEFIETLREKD